MRQRKNGASILVFSELTISGYTCGDLFLQQPLLTECKNQLLRIVKATENKRYVSCCRMSDRYKTKII